MPLSFEANQGQADERVKFLSRGQGYTLFISPSEVLLGLRRAETEKAGTEVEGIGIKLRGANPQSDIVGLDELTGHASYFIGNDPKKWITGVPTYAKARYQQIYPGIDLLFYGNQQQLESDFLIAPGGDPNQIRLRFEGGTRLRVSSKGDLILKTSGGELRLLKPHVYQDIAGTQRPVDGHYVLQGRRTVSFSVGSYDRALPLVIDPMLVYSTALNGANFAVGNGGGHGIAVDAAGDAYVTGYTDRSNFLPTPGAFTTANGRLFVTKLNPAGSGVVYTAVFGGTGSDVAMAIALDAQDEPVLAGFTSSADFPTMNPIQATLPAGTHAFVTKLSAAGSTVLYSTLLGGSGGTAVGNGVDVANAVATDTNGAVYVTGYTNSVDFPTKNGVQPTCPDLQVNGYCNVQGFVAKLDPTQPGAPSIIYSTYLGGKFPTSGQGIAVDTSGNAYITGSTNATDFATTPGVFQATLVGSSDAFVSVLNPSGTNFVYSTFLGSGQGWGIAVDGQGNAYVTGDTNAFGGPFPTTPGAFQTTLSGSTTSDHAFVTKLNPSGTALVYSTFLGGSGFEDNNTGNIAVDAQGNAYVSGFTSSTDFPTANALQAAFGGGNNDAFVTKLNSLGNALIYSTYLGGTGDDTAYGLALDPAGSVYVMGTTSSANFPTTPGAFEPTVNTGTGSVFVAKIGASATTTTLSASANPSVFGQSVSFTTTLSPVGASSLTPTGTVTFSDQGTTLGTATLGSGTAIFNASSLTVGNHSIAAAYGSDSNFAPSASTVLTQVVNQAGTTTSLSASPNHSSFGQSVTLTAVVAVAAPGSGTPSGTVTFMDGTTSLGSGTLNSAGNATFSTSSLSSGSHSLTASYGGDTNFTGSSNPAPVTITVQAPPPPPVQITDNETITVTDAVSFPDVFDAEAIKVSDAVTVTPLINVTAPAVFFSAGGLGFGNIAAGQTVTQSITLSDIGQAPLAVSSAATSQGSAFAIVQVACSNGAISLPTTLPSGGACTFLISYLAPSGSAASDRLTFTDNAALSNLASTQAGSNYVQSIVLNGSGNNTPPPPPPPAVIPIVDNETISVTDTLSFPDVFDGEKITVTDQVTITVLNTPAGSGVSVTPVDTTTGTSPVTLTFTQVTQPGSTSLTTTPTGPAPPSGFQLGNPGVYYNLSTAAIFTGSVTICINYNGISFTQQPQLFHYQNGAWANVTTSVDAINKVLCGTTTSFSPFALFQQSAFPTTTSISVPGITYGTLGSVTVSVSSSGGPVTGSVTLSVDGGGASSMPLSNDSASFSLGVLNAGNHSLSANFVAQGSFLGSSANSTASVAQASLTITPNNASRQYGQANPPLNSVTYSGFVKGDGPASLTGALNCTSTATQNSPVGAYPITCSGLTSTNYTVTFVAGTLTVAPAVVTVTANNATKVLNAANPPLTSTLSGFVNGDTSSVLTSNPTCSTTAVTNSPVASYPITCSGASAANYTFSYVTGTLKIQYAATIGHVIQPPINADGTSVFKQGRTIPAKFSVYDANGVSIGTPGVASSFFLTGIVSGTTTATVEDVVDTNNPDTAFRWDPIGQQWIFNITTGNLVAGSTYIYTIALNDGSTIMFQYGLR